MSAVRRGLSWTLFRYILMETAFSFVVSFLFFFFIFFINQLLLMAEEILSKRVPFGQVALLVLYSLPAIIAMAAPFAALVGTLMAVGRLSSDNEILVILSSGLSYGTVFRPALLAGVCISLLSFLANDVLLPAGTLEFGRLYRRILVSNPALELQANSVKRFKDTVIITGEASRSGIADVVIMDRTGEGERRFIMARDAVLREGSDKASLVLDLNEAFVQSTKENIREDYDYAYARSLRYSINQGELMQAVLSLSPREMSSADVRREIQKKEQTLAVRISEKRPAAFLSALELERTLREGPGSRSWSRRAVLEETFLRESQAYAEAGRDRNLSVHRLEYYKKFSIPSGALFFVFLAVPLGMYAKKSGQTVGFALGLMIAVLYWALLIGGQTLAVRLGYSPFWAMWLPNASALTAGVLLGIARLRR